MGGLRDDLGKKGVVLDVDQLQTLQGVASGGRYAVATSLGTAESTLHVNPQKLGLWPGCPCDATPVALAARGLCTAGGVNERENLWISRW